MSQVSKVKHSRKQWKEKATQRSTDTRSLRRELARVKTERDQATQDLKESQSRLEQLERHAQAIVVRPKGDVVWLSLQLFVDVRISLRAVCRVLSLLALALGIPKAPCPHTVITWGIRLSIVRIESAREWRGLPLSHAPFSNGLIWMIDRSIGLGSGKIVAVLALDAHHHHLEGSAPALHHVHCIAVSVAHSWTGDAIAEVLERLIAQMGRPAASLKDGGSELHTATDWLERAGLASPCIDDISHAAATMLKRSSQHHADFERFVSACGRVSGQLKHTILACLAPPTVRQPALCMCTVCSPGPIGCCNCRPLAAPRTARCERVCARASMSCRGVRASARASEAMPKGCWGARRWSKPRDSLTTPWPSVSP